MKLEIELSKIQNVMAENDTLIIEFIPESKELKW